MIVRWGLYLFCLCIFSMPLNTNAKEVKYNIDIDYKTVNFTGKEVQALTVGGGIPAPTIEATIGDVLEVTFNNKMDIETSIHWHGILLPNDQDGVPYLTTQPIKAGTSFTYRYPIIHHGTYWYHSHTGLQEQRGVYGALVFHPKKEKVPAKHDYVVVFSDWTNESPDRVMANLKKDGDYYALKKGSVQSWLKVLQNGKEAVKNRLQGSWTRMGPMDISDVGYDAFLANGVQKHQLGNARKGDKVRVRMVNAAASSYFNVEFAGGDMTIVSADGVDVNPIKVSRLRMAIAETYDIIVTLPENKAYELRATAEDGTGYSSAIIGNGSLVAANDVPRPNLFLVDHSMHGMSDDNGDMKEMDHSKMDHSKMGHDMMSMQPKINKMQEYERLRATSKTTLPKDNPTREVLLELTGNMERYTWSFNNKTLKEADKILIKKGENVQFKFVNRTMMHHPLHLHGHFFRVLNGQGDYSPLKHTVNVPPMGSVTIEFLANEEKDWFFHCHNLYHMQAGMARVISYKDTTQFNQDILNKLASDSTYFRNVTSVQSNMTSGMIRASNTRNAIEVKYDHNYDHEYDIDAVYERSITRFFEVFAGGNFERDEDLEIENTAIVGFNYVLPMLIDSSVRIDSEGNGRLQLGSEIQLTDRGQFHWHWNTDEEYRFELEYELTKNVSLMSNYDSDFDGGVGLAIKF